MINTDLPEIKTNHKNKKQFYSLTKMVMEFHYICLERSERDVILSECEFS